jgi:carbonic anhydrase/acetyltransferase-like protein (isoleucine patch superfamily)
MLRVGRAYVADTATLTARVTLGEDASLWYGASVRGDDAPIAIGARTNIQDNCVVHVDPGAPNVLGNDITVGHSAICHGVFVGDYALIGMGAVLLSGCRIGEGAVVGAGAVVLEDFEVPPYTLVVGTPARIVKAVDREERLRVALDHSARYVRTAQAHCAGEWDGQLGV